MKIKDGFLIKNIANEWVAVPIGTRTSEISGLVSLSDTGKFLWELLKDEKSENDLVTAMLDEYDVDEQTARVDVKEYLDYLKDNRLVIE